MCDNVALALVFHLQKEHDTTCYLFVCFVMHFDYSVVM